MKRNTENDRSTRPCDDVRMLLALGQPVEETVLQQHLGHCAECRGLALELASFQRELAASAEIDPPPALDRMVRDRLLVEPLAAWSAMRPALAAGLAVAAFVALVAAIAMWIAQTGVGETGPAVALIVASAYLALSAAAALPLLLHGGVRSRLSRSVEVRG